jgi:SpoVK/Ycf46/Vps4 family AAA+-type ATPase
MNMVSNIKTLEKNIVHLARLALVGQRQDVLSIIRRISNQTKKEFPEISNNLTELLRISPSQTSPLRGEIKSIPVDLDSRLNLVRVEPSVQLNIEPIWTNTILATLTQILKEREKEEILYKAGLEPTRTIIFTGLPGVGKSLAAKWLAEKLNRPLLTLDLSAVISSFLGKTGNNLRNVLDYAKGTPCVLLLDEFDSLAKRRDDAIEVGELKRLVTVLLQEIDSWPSTSILIAATNHPSLLDPAIWRRFDSHIDFSMPGHSQIVSAIKLYAGKEIEGTWQKALSILFQKSSFSDIERDINKIKRESIVYNRNINECLEGFVKSRISKLNKHDRIKVSIQLASDNISQRRVNSITGVSRDTIRKKQVRA